MDIVYLGTGAIHGRLNQTIQEFISLALLRTCQFTYRLMHDRVLYQANDVLFKIVAHHFSFVWRICPQRCEGLSQKKRVRELSTYVLYKVSARTLFWTQVIAPRPIDYITRLYIQKMRETRHLSSFWSKKLANFYIECNK